MEGDGLASGSEKRVRVGNVGLIFISGALLAGAFLFIAWKGNLPAVVHDLSRLSVLAVGLVLALLIANAFAAALRLKIVSGQLGHPIRYVDALGTVGTASIAGALFFQIAGQLAARGALMGRKAVPFETVVVITFYERALAALLSLVLALGGAYFIFGQVLFDAQAGGSELVKLVLGLLAAAIAGAVAGYGRPAAAAIQPDMGARFSRVLAVTLLATVLVQLPMLAAYVIAVRQLVSGVAIANLLAASSLVMFAASVPISLAGWGVREMSAVAALGAVGVAAHEAFSAAIMVGAGSLLAMAVVCVVGIPFALRRSAIVGKKSPAQAARGFDYRAALQWSLPTACATLVFFQIHVPTGSGALLNVNLADPIALLCGVLFVLEIVRKGRAPDWRFPGVSATLALTILVLTVSLLHGSGEFGFTQWALVNRYFGWLVLLSYGASAALVVRAGGERGFSILMSTFVAAAAAIAGLELVLRQCDALGLDVLSEPISALVGFAQNRNAFAFQILMALAPAIVVGRGRFRTATTGILIAAMFYTGSRSGWISTAAVVMIAAWFRMLSWRSLCAIAGVATAIVCIETAAAWLLIGSAPLKLPALMPETGSTAERLLSITRGLEMFSNHPFLGAGLGAFRIHAPLTAGGIPLVIHSSYVWLLAEMGLVGFLAFVTPAVLMGWIELRRPNRDRAGKLLLLILTGFALMCAPADMMYQRTFWLLLGACALVLPASRRSLTAH